MLADKIAVCFRRRTGRHGNESACYLDLVHSTAVNNQVPDHRERFCPPWFNGNGLAVPEVPHRKVTGCKSRYGTVRIAVNVHSAAATDPLAAVMVKSHRLFTLTYQPAVQQVKHLEK